MTAYTSSRLPLENTPRGIRPIHRVTRSLAVVAAALGLILGSAPSAHAATIVNMDVNGTGTDYTGPGLLGTSGMTWNYQASAANGTHGPFLNSTNSNSGVTMTLTSMAGPGTDLGGVAPVNFAALYTGYLYFTDATVVLNGLDQNLTYDVVFFSGFSNNDGGTLNRHYGAEITHGGTTLRSYGNLGTGGATTLSNGQNYVLFEDLSPTISGSLTFSMKTNTVKDPNISGFVLGGVGVVNGFQLVAVPEPGTLALLGIVLGTVLLFRRKR